MTAVFRDLGNVPESSDAFTILSTSADRWLKTDLKRYLGSKWRG